MVEALVLKAFMNVAGQLADGVFEGRRRMRADDDAIATVTDAVEVFRELASQPDIDVDYDDLLDYLSGVVAEIRVALGELHDPSERGQVAEWVEELEAAVAADDVLKGFAALVEMVRVFDPHVKPIARSTPPVG